MSNKKVVSTFEKEILDAEFKEKFDNEYKEFVLSELLVALMEGDDISVRKLAKAANLSPTSIQKMRSGTQKDIKIKNFITIAAQLGYKLILEKGDRRIPVGI